MNYNKLFQIILNLPDDYKKKYLDNINNSIDKNKYSSFMKNKKIAIIGPSPSIRKIEDGNYIEKNFDIIIRINKGWKHKSKMDKYIGKRTDVIYNCLDYSEECGGTMDTEYLKNNNVKMIVDPIQYLYDNKKQRDFFMFSGSGWLGIFQDRWNMQKEKSWQ